jgi:deazaflavin-dependent oxidoreductase (nitroreductase family)
MSTVSAPLPAEFMESDFAKRASKLPIILYRMGLGPVLGQRIIILTTRGRRTGLLRHTPTTYMADGEDIYVVSGFGDESDWYQNLQQSPDATLQIGARRFAARANFLDADEAPAILARAQKTNEPFAQVIQNLPEDSRKLVRFTPTGYPPEGEILTDLVWMWFLLIPVALVLLRFAWRHKRFVFFSIILPTVVQIVRRIAEQQNA